jgi:hypothetical protein
LAKVLGEVDDRQTDTPNKRACRDAAERDREREADRDYGEAVVSQPRLIGT